ncbi:MAG: methyltransferase domain-containing protein [Candidatus Obscuribacterales bacterium]|nr:methyltransferase domain-containing protein [Candidatus Obscuribacterales bacterium]
MKPSLLPYLACISCKGQFHLHEGETQSRDNAEGREIISGLLTCKSCLNRYPITNGIPRLVDSRLSTSTDMNTGDRFGDAWKEFSRMDERYEQQFFDWLFPVDPHFLNDKVVLEAGVGKGRHAQIVADSGAKMVFGIDIGHAIDVAYENVGHMPKLHLIQSDIRRLPFNNIFDFAFSVGVLHHMDDPKAGFTSVVDCLKPDGSICIWVYGKENNWWITNMVSPVREAFTTKLPAKVLKLISTTLSVPVYTVSKAVAGPYAKVQNKNKWLPEMFYQAYLSYISNFDFTEVNHIVFDHLIAPVAYYIPRGDVLEWFQDAGFPNPVIRWHNKNSWTGFASHRQHEVETMNARLEVAKNSDSKAFVER